MTTTVGSLKLTIDRWCDENNIDPNCIAIYEAHRGPRCPPGITYQPLEIKELAYELEATNLRLWLRSKPVKENK